VTQELTRRGLGWREAGQMPRVAGGLAALLVAAVTAGCGTVQATHPTALATHPTASATHPTAPATAPSGVATAEAAADCRSKVPARAATPVVVTVASNAKTYCAGVGTRFTVELRGTASSPWTPPVVSGSALATTQQAVAANGVTKASFAAIQPGRAILTSVRPPCRIAVPSTKHELEPAFPLPTVTPGTPCAAGHRFSTLVIVLR